ncbi:MAG: hypothetical protein QM765_05020 [Myxococcales bacterium]
MGLDGCGGTCGTAACADGKQCNNAGVCVVPTCDPACGTDQYCGFTGNDLGCVEICGTVGCAAGETCIHDTDTTGHCQKPTCPPESATGETCKPGQSCDRKNLLNLLIDSSGKDCGSVDDCDPGELCNKDPDYGNFCAKLPCTCTPGYSYGNKSFEDSCASLGLVCPIDITDSSTWVASECRKPIEGEPCDVKVGCGQPADGGKVDCVSGVYNAPECMRSCKNSSGVMDNTLCRGIAEKCGGAAYKFHCTNNMCVPACKGANCTTDADRAKYFKPCTNLTLGDSTCVPVAFEYNGSVYEYGVCEQNGTAPSLGACDPNAVRAEGQTSYPSLCPSGEFCYPVRPATAEDDWTGAVGQCRKYCNAYTGSSPAPVPTGLGCSGAAGDYCMDFTGVPGLTKTILGVCFTKCDPFGSSVCPDDGLGDKQGCYPEDFDSTGNGICVPLQPSAGEQGDTCTLSADKNEKRYECGDRLVCQTGVDSDTGKCVGWCKGAECPASNVVCGGCAGARCCAPDCTGKCNGEADGCGGTCGCPAGKKCDTAANPNACVTCTPDCIGKCNGQPDGCGGTCGCDSGLKCDTRTSAETCYTPICADLCNGEDDFGGGHCGCPVGQMCNTEADPNVCVACTDCTLCGCDGNKVCNATTKACDTCVPACTGKCSGQPDGCGGICGCEVGKKCDTKVTPNACVACVPNCYMRSCGDDGCGGTCGACGSGESCEVVGADEKCVALNPLDPQATAIRICDFH